MDASLHVSCIYAHLAFVGFEHPVSREPLTHLYLRSLLVFSSTLWFIGHKCVNLTSWAQVHELSQSHCGDDGEWTHLFMFRVFMLISLLWDSSTLCLVILSPIGIYAPCLSCCALSGLLVINALALRHGHKSTSCHKAIVVITGSGRIPPCLMYLCSSRFCGIRALRVS